MIELVEFKVEHVSLLSNFGGQERLVMQARERDMADLASRGPAFTGLLNGRVLGCAGLIEANRYRAVAWAILQRTSPRDFIHVHRVVQRVLSNTTYSRIETYVNPKFVAAHRWVEMLGFKLERAYIPFFFPDGSGASEWALYTDGGATCQ